MRLVQRSSVQFVLNALVGIGVGCLFVWLGGRNGGDESQQALAYFVPGIIYNSVYAALMVLSILTRTPAVGLMVGAVSEDPLAWRKDRQIVRLCSTLTWVAGAALRHPGRGPAARSTSAVGPRTTPTPT